MSLAVPADFRVAEQFPGLVSADAKSAVTISEVPRPAEAVQGGLTEAAITARGWALLSSEAVRVDGREGLLVHVDGKVASGRELHRWILSFGKGSKSVVISASTNEQLAGRMGEVLRTTVLSARWDPDRVIGAYEGLGFTLSESESLKISDRLPKLISFTRGGDRGALAPGDPLFLAGSSFAAADVGDLAAFARQQLRATAELDDIEFSSEASLEFDGLPAFELIAAATDRRFGTALRVYQALAIDGRRYFLLQGLVGAESAEEFIPQFRDIAHSFQRAP